MNGRTSALIAACVSLSATALVSAQPVGTSFTYQGRLKQSGLPANSPVDLQFALYDAATGGTSVTPQPICRDNVSVVDGLFTCSLDFGPVFTGTERFLQIGVRPAGAANDCNTGSYTPLNTRQPITTTPYAQWANLGPGGGGDGCCEPRIDVTTLPGSATAKHVISEPGSYFLRSNLTGVSGKSGIQIQASGVTLDLNGFEVLGVAGSINGIQDGLSANTNIEIRNGSVRGWGQNGISLNYYFLPSALNNWIIKKVRVSQNGNSGIDVSSGSGTVMECSAFLNNNAGIRAATAIDSQAFANGYGIDGQLITRCIATDNIGDGITVGFDAAAIDCTSSGNGGIGIRAITDFTVTSCVATNNGNVGIQGVSRGSIIDCTVSGNNDNGIELFYYGTIARCTVAWNKFDGIQVAFANTVRDNECYGNGHPNISGNGAQIHAIADSFQDGKNRIEGNNCGTPGRGVEVSSSNNIIFKNSCSGTGTAWSIASDNVYGPIIDRRAPASPAVNGFSAAGSFSTTDPNANFSY